MPFALDPALPARLIQHLDDTRTLLEFIVDPSTIIKGGVGLPLAPPLDTIQTVSFVGATPRAAIFPPLIAAYQTALEFVDAATVAVPWALPGVWNVCRQLTPMASPLEVLLLTNAVGRLSTDQGTALQTRLAQLLRTPPTAIPWRSRWIQWWYRMPRAARALLGVGHPCPFLVGGTCAAGDARPLVCRLAPENMLRPVHEFLAWAQQLLWPASPPSRLVAAAGVWLTQGTLQGEMPAEIVADPAVRAEWFVPCA